MTRAKFPKEGGTRAACRDDLFDLLAAEPDGLTIPEMTEALSVGQTRIQQAIRDLRLFLGEFDSINVINERQGRGEPHRYRLVGTFNESREWVIGRINDTESRLKTLGAVSASLVAATDGRSAEGKRARLISKVVTRLVEDLHDFEIV